MEELRITTTPSIVYFGVDITLKSKLSILIGDSAIGKSYAFKALIARKPAELNIKIINNRDDINSICETDRFDLIVFDNSELYFNSIQKTKDIYNFVKEISQYIVIIDHGNWRYDLIAGAHSKLKLNVDHTKRMVIIHD